MAVTLTRLPASRPGRRIVAPAASTADDPKWVMARGRVPGPFGSIVAARPAIRQDHTTWMVAKKPSTCPRKVA
ncbi:hypothetical protein, partial [Serratia marcescens]|uniref:hypothetical protein n=1 Tax=Serratia marcescens TaxID=615 RepID=UPI001954F57B